MVSRTFETGFIKARQLMMRLFPDDASHCKNVFLNSPAETQLELVARAKSAPDDAQNNLSLQRLEAVGLLRGHKKWGPHTIFTFRSPQAT